MPERLMSRRHGSRPASSTRIMTSVPNSEAARSQLPIQKLYSACKEVFSGGTGPVSAQALERVRILLDNIKPCDVGVEENVAAVPPDSTGLIQRINVRQDQQIAPPILYLHIYDCEDFSMGIFCLPASAIIPLHNHPGMTVLSKLLYGSMHVKAYDWVDQMQLSYPRLGRQVSNCVVSAPCEPSVLYPTSGGNIHAFTAITSCAVLDVLAPPYSIEDGRHCTYYRDFPYPGDDTGVDGDAQVAYDAEMALLSEYRPPDEFCVQGAPYQGPEILL